MKKSSLLLVVCVLIAAILAATVYLRQTNPPVEKVEHHTPQLPTKPERQGIVHYPVPVPITAEEASVSAVPEPAPPKKQVETPAMPEKLPPVEQSDQSFAEVLTQLKLKPETLRLLLLDNFIQRFVTTIDNLPEKKLSRSHIPLQSPEGRFLVAGTNEQPQTSTRNWQRYERHVRLLEQLDPQFVVKMYIHFYPLFQKAFEQLGYKNAYFNDRLVFVLDHLLQTPNPAEPQALHQPAVLYTFADPLLEQLSFGQKALLRIGPENRARVIAVLRTFRSLLVNLEP